VPDDDLRSIRGLQQYRDVLSRKLGIASLRTLAEADERAIYDALKHTEPRPTLKRIAAWQTSARRKLQGAEIDRSAWHTATSFAVVFAQRQIDGVWERRIEAQQTEVEPSPEPQQWAGWDCSPLCDWMTARLGPPRDQADAEPGAADQTGTAVEPAARGVGPRRAELRIESATITDAVHEIHLIKAGELTQAPPEDLTHPVRLRLTVRGRRSGQQLRAAVWFRREAEPGWSPQEPVVIPATGHVQFDLSSVPPGEHNIKLLAWAADPPGLAAVTLPKLTFHPEAEDGDGSEADP
jgi:hypothetical protein